MIINNTHVQGIFFYSPDIAYEKGDFVVQNNIIYICTANNPTDEENFTVQNSDPSTDRENYTVYLGDKIESAEEYFEYVENPEAEGVEDKYVSSHSLFRILSSYMSGFDEKGIISKYFSYDGTNISYSENLTDYLEGAERTDLLDKIIQAADLNNAIFHINRSVVGDIFPSIPEDITGFNSTDLNSVILKQYTYQDSAQSNKIYRVQELIDHVNGIVLYRYSSNDSNYSSISTWKNSFLEDDFKNQVDCVKNYYKTKSEELETEKQNLQNNFAFRNVRMTKGQSVNIQCSNSNEMGYVNVSDFNDTTSCILTIIVQEQYLQSTSNVYKNSSLTIDISDAMSADEITSYYVTNNNTLTIEKTAGSTSTKSLILTVSSGRIVNIYYRQFYKAE